jgi:MOSC domain-containing protein YiiM
VLDLQPWYAVVTPYPQEDPMGKVTGLFTCPDQGQPMISHEMVSVIAGKGIIGDRYYLERGFYTPIRPGTVRQITIISAEAIRLGNARLAAMGQQAYEPAQTRRNVVIECDPELLNGLVGRESRLGSIRIRGAELATPCHRPALLRDLREKGFVAAYEGLGGVRVAALNDGMIRLGDELCEF